jgi:hypothetical protein
MSLRRYQEERFGRNLTERSIPTISLSLGLRHAPPLAIHPIRAPVLDGLTVLVRTGQDLRLSSRQLKTNAT